MRLSVAVAIACLSVAGLSAADDVKAAIRRNTDIPAQGLGPALQMLAKEHGFQIVYVSDEVNSLRTQGASGELTSEEALTELLLGTGLTFRSFGESAVSIVPAVTRASPPSDARPMDRANESAGWFRRLRLAQLDESQRAASSFGGAQQDVSTLEEVVVTAQKRLERLQDVPIPVTALSGDSLIDNNQLRLQDLYTRVPTLNFVMGIRGEPALAIRGVTTNWAGNPTVGVVIDDVPYGASTANGGGFTAPDIDPSDLARLEVLRGPQGTLYGASSLGGLLKFVTIDPSTSEFAGRVQVGVSGVHHGDDSGYNVRGSVNVPLSDTFALRASAFTRRDPGYIDDPARGLEDVNQADANGGRLAALWQPSDDLSIKVSALIQDKERDGSADVHQLPGLGEWDQNALRGTGKYRIETKLFSATVDAKLGAADLLLLSGYNDNAWSAVVDDTAIFGSLSQFYFQVAGASLPEDAQVRKFTQEVRLSGPAGERLDWLLGAFYTHEKTDWLQAIRAVDPATGASPGSVLDYVFGPTEFEEYAAFADLTIQITDQFDVQIGGRQSRNEQSHDERFEAGPLFPAPLISPTVRTDATAFTYLFTPRLKLSPDLMVYARLASGYRPGGPNQLTTLGNFPSSFDPDRSQNYEIGVKGDALDHALSFDASIYYIDWKDVQIEVRDADTAFRYTTNASRAKSQGVDLSVESRPVHGLTVAAWVAWNEAELTDPFPVGSTSFGASGDRLPFSARLSGNLSLDWDFPLPSGLTGSAGASLSYIGDRKSTFTSTSARQQFPAYAQTDLRAGVRNDSWATNLFITNLTDRRGLLSGGLDSANPSAFTYIQPRTIGLSLSKAF